MNTNIRKNCLTKLTQKIAGDIEEWGYIENRNFDDLLKGWLKRIIQGLNNPKPFESFIYLWFIFNSWLSSIAPDPDKNEHDFYLIRIIAGSDRFNARFRNLFSPNSDFKGWVEEFVSLGPIFRVAWLKRNKLPPWDSKEVKREIYVNATWKKGINQKKTPKVSPECFEDHKNKKIPIPFDWTHTIHMIYQVRCNLFHGGKGFESKEDSKFVQLALNILWTIFKEEDFVKNTLRDIGELDPSVQVKG